MLDMNLIRENPELVKAAMKHRQMDSEPVDRAVELDVERRTVLSEVQALKADRNAASKEIGKIRDPKEREARISAMKSVSDRIAELDAKVKAVEAELTGIMAMIPNIPNANVPIGVGDTDNPVLRTEGTIPTPVYDLLPHWELAERLNIIDFERGVKLTGSRFYVLNGVAARLQRALIAFMLDLHTSQGYVERYTPFMVKEEVLYAAGQLPKFKENLYRDAEEDYWMG